MNRTKMSDAAPNWFHVITDGKTKEWDKKMVNSGETLFVFSRFQKWITVTPKGKNRKKPLEKIKKYKMEETSKVMPNWMQIKPREGYNKEDTMKSAEYKYNVIFS